MASHIPLAEVAAPDGRLYLIGSGGFAQHVGGPFSVVAYPFGRTEQDWLKARPTYIEAVRHAGAFQPRLKALTDAIQAGTWAPPELSEDERGRLEQRAARREAGVAAARQRPFATTMRFTLQFAIFLLVITAAMAFSDVAAGRAPAFPSVVGLLSFVAAWSLLLGGLKQWSVRRSSGAN